jgi:chorismate mutase/prephenate dehydratase
MTRALEELNNLTKFVKVLGCYPSDEVTPTEIQA